MERRSTRRVSNENSSVRNTRLDKNSHLYDEVNHKIGYGEVVELDTQTRIDLASLREEGVNRREKFQKVKEYQSVLGISTPNEEKISNHEKEEEKNYDINSVLQEAKKNRIYYDELEKKRKLKDSTYKTLAEIDTMHLQEKAEIHKDIDEKELTELINTITSHNLLKEIEEQEKESSEELLSDLIATKMDLDLETGIAEEYSESSEDKKIINSFYTQSMDLSDQDFEFSEELEKERKLKIKILSIVIIVLILLVIGTVAFFLLKRQGLI